MDKGKLLQNLSIHSVRGRTAVGSPKVSSPFVFSAAKTSRSANARGFPSIPWRPIGKKVPHWFLSRATSRVLKNAPHPNAAKVFINWLLSREGQIELQRVLAKVQPAESHRNDIPKDDVPSDVRRKPGEKYMDLDSHPEWSDMEPVRKLLNDTVKEAKK